MIGHLLPQPNAWQIRLSAYKSDALTTEKHLFAELFWASSQRSDSLQGNFITMKLLLSVLTGSGLPYWGLNQGSSACRTDTLPQTHNAYSFFILLTRVF